MLGSANGPNAMNLTQAKVARGIVFGAHKQGAASQTGVTVTPLAGKTFADALQAYLPTRKIDDKEAVAYRRLLQRPISALDVARITVDDVLAALEPWAGRQTAGKMVLKIACVLTYAKDRGWRTGDNPADAAKRTMPAIAEPKPIKALPASELPALWRNLAAIDKPAARALQWCILTASRTSETLGATWGEVNGDWSIPGERMKEGKDHTVPLSTQAHALIGDERGDDGDHLFGHMGQTAMLVVFKKLCPGFDVHRLRKTFSDWAGDAGYSTELREIALAHAVGGSTFQSYNEGDRRNLRRDMMAAYADFVTGVSLPTEALSSRTP
ncbi:MAG: site-specific integrase [Xanthobacteraceae bacterium]